MSFDDGEKTVFKSKQGVKTKNEERRDEPGVTATDATVFKPAVKNKPSNSLTQTPVKHNEAALGNDSTSAEGGDESADDSDKTQFAPRVRDQSKASLPSSPSPLTPTDGARSKIPSKSGPKVADVNDIHSSKTFTSLSPDEQKRVAKLAAQRKRARQKNRDDKTQLKSHSSLSASGLPSDETNIKSSQGVPEDRDSQSQYESDEHDQGRQEIPDGKSVLKNRFNLESVLGAGGMGVVYKATDKLKIEAQDRDPYVAIKVLGEEFKSHPEAFIALQRESRKTQRIAHPNIVNVHDFDRDGDTVFMTMEFMDGEPLDKIISKYKATGLPEDMAWHVLKGISAALIHAHNEKIIHSDFKPGNIFVTSKGFAKVFDFGIARAVANAESLEESVDDKTVFDAGNLGALTPAYASMEMLNGETPDVRDDIYALGCIAYELFTGKHPYNRLHANEAAKLKLKPKRIAILSKKQSRVIERAVAFKREDRVESVQNFWSLLNVKKASIVLNSIIALSFIAILSFAVFQYYESKNAQNDFSEDDIRDEIEIKLRLETHKSELKKLLLDTQLSVVWESSVWEHIQGATRWLPKGDVWLLSTTQALYLKYVESINALIGADNFERANVLLTNASRYTSDNKELNELSDKLDEAKKAYKAKLVSEDKKKIEREKQRKIEAQKKALLAKSNKEQAALDQAFNVAMDTVNKQLSCRSSINMRDFGVAVEKLRSLDAQRYSSQEPNIISTLVACISKVGRSFPERAEQAKILALRTFPKNMAIAGIKIIPKDPCDVSLAGLGARGDRASCRDKMEGLGKGPSMVVIPAKGSIKAFAMAKYEVSNGDFNMYCKDSGDCSSRSSAGLPVTNISSSQIDAYLKWISSKTKQNYRLPTRAQWTYAAKGTNARLDSNRNCELNSRGIQKGKSLIKTSVGQANAWGLVSMVGNAQELVKITSRKYFALGGSFKTPMEECVIEYSNNHNGEADEITGFRFVREIPNQD